jgi:acetylornithine deacetylase
MKHPSVQLLEELIAIESVNPAYEGATDGECHLADFIEAHARRAGLVVQRQPVLPGRDNLIIELRGSSAANTPRPTLLFEAHMDTVALGNMPTPLVPTYADGRLYGRGACDTKGSLAAMLCALEQAVANAEQLSCDVVLCATVDEEHGFRGVLEVLELGLQVDGAVVGEPTALDIVTAHKGVCRFAVETHGKAAHSSMPDQGNSAIMQMLPVLDFITQTIEPELKWHEHPLCGAPTIVVGTIRGGTQINIVPEKCVIEVDRRVVPGENSRAVLQAFETRLGTATQGRGVQWTIQELLLDEPLDTNINSDIVVTARHAAQELSLSCEVRGVPYGSDASKLQAYGGIPSIVFGPGSIAQAHSRTEYVAVSEVEQAFQFYSRLMQTFGAKGTAE